jgi:hypothetical protein
VTIARRAARAALQRVIGKESTLTLARHLADGQSRLEYALSRRGQESARRLRDMKDRYRGERCFIIGNGPSLRGMDLSALRTEYTFGLNRAPLLFPRMGFQTTFLVCVNRLVIEQSGAELLDTSCTKFVSWQGRRFLPTSADVTYLRSIRGPRFAMDPSQGVWEGGTVTFVAMQLAFHLGFETVILIGVDHSFATKGPPNQQTISGGDDPNHFDPSYFGKGYRWHLPDLERSEIAYGLARDQFEASGRTIVDATVGGKLVVFPKASFDALARDPQAPRVHDMSRN